METNNDSPRPSRRPFFRFVRFWYDRLSLSEDKDNELEIIEATRKNVVFKGVNLWTLVFAIFIASIGLNVNSTAVVIGAMLISPLMGPIVGVGLGVAINDFDLIKNAGTNIGVAVAASVLTSSLYFAVTPLSDASSELLARTSPTIWDVMIAFFGGMAGIVAGASKEKGNVIPGVAIATALMPPLCTAGYGLANWIPKYFLGAMYLFFINSVMISLSTFLVARFLNFPSKGFVDVQKDRMLRRSILLIVIITVTPSIYLGYRIVSETIYNRAVNLFLRTEMNWENTQVVLERHEYHFNDSTTLEVLLAGEPISQREVKMIERRMPEYGITKTKLIVRQGAKPETFDINQLKTQVIEDLYTRNMAVLEVQDSQIKFLEEQLELQYRQTVPVEDIAEELIAMYPQIISLNLGRAPGLIMEDNKRDTVGLALIRTKNGRLGWREQKRISDWLCKRTDLKEVRVLVEK